MRNVPKIIAMLAGAPVATVGAPLSAWAADDLRQAAQNPVADLISLPFQNNTNFGVGKLDNTQNILDIQPVIPVHLNQDWNLVDGLSWTAQGLSVKGASLLNQIADNCPHKFAALLMPAFQCGK
jgi:hypothetical protein